MRKSLLSVTLLTAVFAGGFAFADETFGTIKSIDAAAKTVTLGDGIAYVMNDGTSRYEMVDGYLPGDKVVVAWAGDKHEVSAIGPDFTHGMNGDVKAVNVAKNTVTLGDGVVYTFKDTKGAGVNLKTYKAGDEVTIVATKKGKTHIARAISGHSKTEETGKVKAINKAERLITLEDGTVYSFLGKDGETVALKEVKAGEMVKIKAINVGNNHWGYAISHVKG